MVSNRVSGKVSGPPPPTGGKNPRMSGNPLGAPLRGAPKKGQKRVKKGPNFFSTLAAWILVTLLLACPDPIIGAGSPDYGGLARLWRARPISGTIYSKTC